MVNGEKFQSQIVTLTLIVQCLLSNSSELFSNTTTCSSFKWIEPFFLLSCTQTHTHRRKDTQTLGHTDGHEYSIVVVDQPQLCVSNLSVFMGPLLSDISLKVLCQFYIYFSLFVYLLTQIK